MYSHQREEGPFSFMYRSLSRPCKVLYQMVLDHPTSVKFFPLGTEEPRSKTELMKEQMLYCKGGWS
jgi:hypothetical protein